MKNLLKMAIIAGLSLGITSANAWIYKVIVNPSVKDKGGNMTYTKKIVLGGYEHDTFPMSVGSKDYDTGGICIWESEIDIGSGPFSGEKIIVSHGSNACSSKTLTVGTKGEFAGRQGVVTGEKGQLDVLIQ